MAHLTRRKNLLFYHAVQRLKSKTCFCSARKVYILYSCFCTTSLPPRVGSRCPAEAPGDALLLLPRARGIAVPALTAPVASPQCFRLMMGQPWDIARWHGDPGALRSGARSWLLGGLSQRLCSEQASSEGFPREIPMHGRAPRCPKWNVVPLALWYSPGAETRSRL